MVKLVIEDKAWSDPRLKRLAAELKLSKEEALARLLTLWHGSQSEGLIECDEASLKIWYDEEHNIQELLEALCKAKYLKLMSNGKFRVAGNEFALSQAKARKTRAKSAANSRWKIEGIDDLIGHYCQEFKRKFAGQNPVITGKEAGAARNLVKTLGLEKAKLAVTGFFQLKDSYYMNKLYPLSDLQNASVLNKISVAQSTGIEVNATLAKKAEAVSANQTVGLMWLRSRQEEFKK